MCAGTSKGRERNEGMLVAGCDHIHHCIPRCCRGPKQAGAQCSRAHQIETLERKGIKARNKEGFAVAVTLSGFIAVDVSQTPRGPALAPLPPPHTWTLTRVDPHTLTQKGWDGGKEVGVDRERDGTREEGGWWSRLCGRAECVCVCCEWVRWIEGEVPVHVWQRRQMANERLLCWQVRPCCTGRSAPWIQCFKCSSESFNLLYKQKGQLRYIMRLLSELD